MSTKFFVDEAGTYLGGFDGAEPPIGAIEVPFPPDDARQIWDGSNWNDIIIAPTEADVIAERERRLALGLDYNFGDSRGIHHIGTTEQDMRKWMDEVTPFAQAYINSGNPNGPILISTETGPVDVTAAEWQMILLAAGAYRQSLFRASFVLQQLSPIPSDYKDDKYWV